MDWNLEKENLERLILTDKVSYEEIGRMYGCTGSNIRRVAKKLNINTIKRRSINANETFNKGRKLVVRYCLNCGKELSNRHNTTKYCNNVCQAEYEHKEYIRRWKEGKETGMCGTRSISKHIRDYLMDKHERKCQVCGWDKIHPITGEPPLHVHHIDGDATNNSEDNLQLLCPNCHSLTENYGRLNAKNTRPKK